MISIVSIHRLSSNGPPDHNQGNLYPPLYLNDAAIPVSDILSKGNIGKTNYHFSMFMPEAIRLGEAYKDRIDSLSLPLQATP